MPLMRVIRLLLLVVVGLVIAVAVGAGSERARAPEMGPAFDERLLATGARGGHVLLADVDGDGRPEPVLVGEDARAGRPVPGASPVGAVRLRSEYGPVALGDVDGDGALDAASQDLDRRALQVAFGDGRGGFRAPVLAPRGGAFDAGDLDLEVADLDADGRDEVVLMTVGFGEDERPTAISVTRVDADRRIGRPVSLPRTPRTSRVKPPTSTATGTLTSSPMQSCSSTKAAGDSRPRERCHAAGAPSRTPGASRPFRSCATVRCSSSARRRTA